MSTLEEPIDDAKRTEIGGLIVDEVPAGDVRVKRVMYPPGWRWSERMADTTGTGSCQHLHVGFLAQGTMAVRLDDGREAQRSAPAAVVLRPGHVAWVVGDVTAVLIQLDSGSDTAARLGRA